MSSSSKTPGELSIDEFIGHVPREKPRHTPSTRITSLVVTGDTFPYRKILRAEGCNWDPSIRAWHAPSVRVRDEMQAMVHTGVLPSAYIRFTQSVQNSRNQQKSPNMPAQKPRSVKGSGAKVVRIAIAKSIGDLSQKDMHMADIVLLDSVGLRLFKTRVASPALAGGALAWHEVERLIQETMDLKLGDGDSNDPDVIPLHIRGGEPAAVPVDLDDLDAAFSLEDES